MGIVGDIVKVVLLAIIVGIVFTLIAIAFGFSPFDFIASGLEPLINESLVVVDSGVGAII